MMPPLTITVAEDDKHCREFITVALDAMGATVLGVDSLREFWKTITNRNVDAVWLDLALLDSTAEETLAAIPKIRQLLPQATIIVVSGWEDTHRKRALDLGADAYSGKIELGAFRVSAVARLLSVAAVAALKRGAAANVILERVARFVGDMCQHEPCQSLNPPQDDLRRNA